MEINVYLYTLLLARNHEDFVVQRIIKWRFYCIYFWYYDSHWWTSLYNLL